MLQFFAKRLHQIHQNDRKGQKGFTLIELLVVVIIIGILAAIAIPVFLAQRERAQIATVESDLRNAGSAYSTCYAETETHASCNTAVLLDPYGFNQSEQVDAPTFTGDGETAVISATHALNTDVSGTFTAATGRVVVDVAAAT